MTIQEQFSKLGGNVLIGGQMRQSSTGRHLDVINPATEAVLGQIAETGGAEIDEAVSIARAAQAKWNALASLERAHTLRQVADRMTKLRAPPGEALMLEMGKPYWESPIRNPSMKSIGRPIRSVTAPKPRAMMPAGSSAMRPKDSSIAH